MYTVVQPELESSFRLPTAPKVPLAPFAVNPCSPTAPQAQAISYLLSVYKFQINGIIPYAVFCVWLLSVIIMLLRLVRLVSCAYVYVLSRSVVSNSLQPHGL